MNPKSIFSVSLKGNIETLRISIPTLLKLYPDTTYYLIVQKEDVLYFESELKFFSSVVVVDEGSLISYEDFLATYHNLALLNLVELNEKRLRWYYQQVLKIIFALQFQECSPEKYPMVMFDADTIPLKKIKFFNDGNQSVLYGSLSECHEDYFKSIECLFGPFERPAMGFTTQFFSVTLPESLHLKKILSSCDFNNDETNLSLLIARAVLISTIRAHGTIEGSKFSEQELFGLSNRSCSGSIDQKPIFSLRSWILSKSLSRVQMRLLAILGIALLTYEKRCTFDSRRLGFVDFLRILMGDIRPQIKKYVDLRISKPHLNKV
jgi:hypothetical protein